MTRRERNNPRGPGPHRSFPVRAGRYLIKICGNRYLDDSLLVAAHRPDFMGWIFSPRSPRRITTAQAAIQIRSVRAKYPAIRHVAVFADNSVPEMGAIMAALPELDYAQVAEDSGLLTSLRAALGGGRGWRRPGIIPALRVQSALAPAEPLRYGPADLFQMDSYVKGQPGGTGHRLAGQLVQAVTRPFLLAGGLKPENVAEALAATPAVGADVSSGLEDPGAPGRKNPHKVAAFVATVRALSC